MNTIQIGPEEPGQDTRRMLAAVVLSTLVYLVWQWFLVPAAPGAEAPAAEAGQAGQADAAPSVGVATAQPGGAAPLGASPDAVPGATPRVLPESLLSTSVDVAAQAPAGGGADALKGGYVATTTNLGAQLAHFQLTGYLDVHRKPAPGQAPPFVDLHGGGHEGAHLLALQSRGGDVNLRPADAYELVEQSAAGATYARLTDAGVRITRTYRFDPAHFGFTHTITLRNESGAPRRTALDLVLVGQERAGERDEGSAFAPSTDQLAAACRAGGDQERWPSQELEEPEERAGAVRYAAIDRHFFLAALMPAEGTPTLGCRVEPWSRGGGEGEARGMALAVQQAEVTLDPGASQTFEYHTYFGPKQVHALQEAGYDLDENIQFGWFGVLSRPMLWILVRLYDWLGNFGIAIILLTLLMKAATFPLTQKSYVSMQQMKTLAPEMKKLQEKYGHDRATLGQKQMELYKDKGVNPMAGCLPVFVQMPIWFALYRTLWNSVELYQQPFYLGIQDLSQPEGLLFGFPLLPLIVGGLMLFQTMMQPPPEDQPQMKYVMWGMPVMFTFFMLQMPSGLSLYMITNSLLTMAQQYYIKRRYS